MWYRVGKDEWVPVTRSFREEREYVVVKTKYDLVRVGIPCNTIKKNKTFLVFGFDRGEDGSRWSEEKDDGKSPLRSLLNRHELR